MTKKIYLTSIPTMMLLFCSKFIDGILFNIKLYIYSIGTETGSHFRRSVWPKISEIMGKMEFTLTVLQISMKNREKSSRVDNCMYEAVFVLEIHTNIIFVCVLLIVL